MWTETGGQRDTCSLPVPPLPPCSRDKTCWCPVAHKPGDQTQSYRGVKKNPKSPNFPPVFPVAYGPYTQLSWQEPETPKLSSPCHSLRQKWRSGSGPTLALSDTELAARALLAFPSCVMDFINSCSTNFDDPAPQTLLGTISLTLRVLGKLLGEFVQANRVLPQHVPSLPWLWLI